MKSNANLKGKVLLDYSRGLRGEKNSKTLLQKLINSYSNRFNLFLYQTPNLRGIYKLFPERSKEIFGVMHMKIYIADDTLVISG
jgi:CDP-diacylglycerol--glycerol-3-phosphate 3-phosphatidyltransferase